MSDVYEDYAWKELFPSSCNIHDIEWKEADIAKGVKSKLDEIKVAGRIEGKHIKKLYEKCGQTHEWAKLVVDVIENGLQGLWKYNQEKYQKQPPKEQAPEVQERYAESIRKLEKKWRLLGSVKKDDEMIKGRIVVGYFEVWKEIEVSTRSIIDARWANQAFPQPNKIRLITIGEIIAIFGFFKTPFFATADLRHYYHMIRIAEGDRKFFTLFFRDRLLEWLSLPMGFSWAPFIAQVIATLALMANQSKWDIQFPFRSDRGPPPFIIIKRNGRIVAFLVVWIDNILVVADCEQTRDNLIATIKKNIEDLLNGVLKGENEEEKVQKTKKEVKYFGAVWNVGDGKIAWQHAEKNIKRWSEIEIKEQMTTERVARICGRCVWDTTLRNQYWRRGEPMERIIKIVKRGQKEVEKLVEKGTTIRKAWKITSVKLTEEEIQMMEKVQEELLENRKTELDLRELEQPSRYIVLAADASNKGRGGLQIDMEGKAMKETIWSEAWREEDQVTKKHISIKELRTLQECVDRVVGPKESHIKVFAMEDNSSVVAWVRRSFCPEEEECEELRKWLEDLESRRILLEMVQMPTEIQPADGPSRLEIWGAEDDERVERSWEFICNLLEMGNNCWRTRKRKR